jgi:hypothetical protein
MKLMENVTKEEFKSKQKGLEKSREKSIYEKQVLEVYYLAILQYAIFITNHNLISKVKEFYKKHGYDFDKYFSLAEQQLNKIENPEIALKQFINSMNSIIKSF